MKTKEEIQLDMKQGLLDAEKKIAKMKKELKAAGDKGSDQAQEALAEAENLWEQAKVKYDEVADASEEEFEDLRDAAVENWEALSKRMNAGWATISEKFKGMFS